MSDRIYCRECEYCEVRPKYDTCMIVADDGIERGVCRKLPPRVADVKEETVWPIVRLHDDPDWCGEGKRITDR